MPTRFDALLAHRAAHDGTKIADLFGADPARAQGFSARHGDVLFDFSKTQIDTQALDLLLKLADGAGVATYRDAMFAGARINETEGRAVLHTALRNLSGRLPLDGQDVMPALRATHERAKAFARDLRAGRFQGQGGRITDVVNIGIGGSDLGPAMAALALAPFADGRAAISCRMWMAPILPTR